MCIYRWLITVVGGFFFDTGHRVLFFSSILGCTTSGSRLEVSGYIRLIEISRSSYDWRMRKGCWGFDGPLGDGLTFSCKYLMRRGVNFRH